MRIKKKFLAFTALVAVTFSQAQTIPASRRVDWSNPGYGSAIPTTYGAVINITSYGANGSDHYPDDVAVNAAVAAANPNVLTMIYFPTGHYIFNNPITITKSNIVLKGAGPSYTKLTFNTMTRSCITIQGSEDSNEIPISTGAAKDTKVLQLNSVTSLQVGDYIEIKRDMIPEEQCAVPDADGACEETTSNHAYGQIVKITDINIPEKKITIEDGLSMDHNSNTFRLRKLNMVERVGIQDLYITERHFTNDITDYTIYANRVARVWISGVESYLANKHHFGVERSTRVEIRGCYINQSRVYTDGGYSIYIGMRSTNCLAENNILTFHRHCVVLSGSPNRNVVGYNYSTATKYGGEPSEFLCHGYYPHSNLFEGNIGGSMDIDQYWGKNGPFNTLFRNSFTHWTIKWAPNINIVGNRSYVNYYSSTYSDLLNANNSETSVEPTSSFYHASKPDFLNHRFTWPAIGAKASASGPVPAHSNSAMERFKNGGQFTINRRDPIAGYSIANTGLYSVFNGASGSGNVARTYRNPGELSIGGEGYYANSDLNWVAGPIATVMLSSGQEEILSAYNYNHPTTKYASVYLSSGKNPNSQSLVFTMPNCVITALTTGDFNGDGVDEIVIAFLQNGMPRLYKSNTPTNLTQTLLYSNGSDYWTINSLCTGDFDGNGNDELIIGMNSTGVDTRIFKSVNADGIGTAIYTHTGGYWRVGALAAIDSDGNGSDELIQGFNCSDGTAIYRSIGATTSSGLIYPLNDTLRVSAMAVGDMDNDGDEELLTGFNYTKPGTMNQGVVVFKSETVGKIDDVCIYHKVDLGMRLRSLVVEKIHPTAPGGRPMALETQENMLQSKNPAQELLVSPNPATRILNIALTGAKEGTQVIEMYNSLGTLSLSGELQNGTGVLELTGLNPGVYFIRANTDNGTLQEKVIIQ
ncbi:FG-GAP repeat protein [compost metagenome]